MHAAPAKSKLISIGFSRKHVSVDAPVETPQNATQTGPAQMAAKKTKRVLMAALSIKGLAMGGK